MDSNTGLPLYQRSYSDSAAYYHHHHHQTHHHCPTEFAGGVTHSPFQSVFSLYDHHHHHHQSNYDHHYGNGHYYHLGELGGGAASRDYFHPHHHQQNYYQDSSSPGVFGLGSSLVSSSDSSPLTSKSQPSSSSSSCSSVVSIDKCSPVSNSSSTTSSSNNNNNVEKYTVLQVDCTEPNCAASFGELTALEHHLVEVHHIHRHRCVHFGCEQSFRVKCQLEAHIATTHAEVQTWKCRQCKRNFSRRLSRSSINRFESLLNHFSRFHVTGRFRCTNGHCGTVTECAAKANDHYKQCAANNGNYNGTTKLTDHRSSVIGSRVVESEESKPVIAQLFAPLVKMENAYVNHDCVQQNVKL